MTRSRHGSAARRCQRGVAIIMVMLMVALAIIAVTAMVTGQRLDMYRTANRVVQTQARKLALAGARFANHPCPGTQTWTPTSSSIAS